MIESHCVRYRDAEEHKDDPRTYYSNDHISYYVQNLFIAGEAL